MNKILKIPYILLDELLRVIEFFIVYSPKSRIGNLFRKLYWKLKLNIGKNPNIDRSTVFENSHLIEIGDDFLAGVGVTFGAGDCKGIFVGNNVLVAQGTYLRSGNHNFVRTDIPIREQGHTCASIPFRDKEYSIIIENDCWIASNCTILSGSHIGEGSVLSANTVVSGKIPPYSIVIGNPGRVIKNRKKMENR